MAYDVTVRQDDCISAGRCVAAAPDLFEFDDDDIARVIPAGPRPDDATLLRIAQDCPNLAIDLTDDGVPVEL